MFKYKPTEALGSVKKNGDSIFIWSRLTVGRELRVYFETFGFRKWIYLNSPILFVSMSHGCAYCQVFMYCNVDSCLEGNRILLHGCTERAGGKEVRNWILW